MWSPRFRAVHPEVRLRWSWRATRLLVPLQLVILPIGVSAQGVQVPDPVPKRSGMERLGMG